MNEVITISFTAAQLGWVCFGICCLAVLLYATKEFLDYLEERKEQKEYEKRILILKKEMKDICK
jgi:cbb3-type cytochrome oxidase subunit 3